MTTVERLPPACAFALSVLSEFDADPDAVPEEAVEAAQHHIHTCPHCIQTHAIQKVSPSSTSPSANTSIAGTLHHTKNNTGRGSTPSQTATKMKAGESSSRGQETRPVDSPATASSTPTAGAPVTKSKNTATSTTSTPRTSPIPEPRGKKVESNTPKRETETLHTPSPEPLVSTSELLPLTLLDALDSASGGIDCHQCRAQLKQYAEALDSGEDTGDRFAEVETHLLGCEAGCLVLLDIYRQEAKATRKYRRRPVRNPFSAIGWELTGFFRAGQVPMSPMALSYGTLILLLLVASLSAYLGIRWDDGRYYHPQVATLPTPDGVGVSDGLHIYDACNTVSYRDKRNAAQAMQDNNVSQAQSLLKSAMNAPLTDTTGCNGAEAAIYLEDLHVRQSGRPFGIVVVGFDSGVGNADPHGGTDRHILYAAYTQELIGAYISQQQYNAAQMQKGNAPLLYVVLANSTGTTAGAMQIASNIAALKAGHTDGLLVSPSTASPATSTSPGHPLLAVLGLGPNTLVQNVLPTLCTLGIPLISATSTGQFLIDVLSQTSLYQHCAAGFSFTRFSAGDTQQSTLAASYAYGTLHVHNLALFYDPNDPSSSESAQSFQNTFLANKHTKLVAEETTADGTLLDTSSAAGQAAHDALLAQLHDALQAKPDILFAPLSTNDVILLAQTIAQLPQNQQPVLMLGGTFVPPSSLQRLVQWTRQQQLLLPRIFVAQSAVERPPTESWQKQFYASLCTSFASSANYCSGTASIDQGALLFGDSMEMVTTALSSLSGSAVLPTSTQLSTQISKEQFQGVSGPIALRIRNSVIMVSTKALPVLLGVQGDGSIQIIE